MTANQEILEASINIDITLTELWRLLISTKTLESITSLSVRSDINVKEEKGNGVLTIGRGIFFINYTPYDITLNGVQAKIRVQLMELGSGSCIMIACLLSDNSILNLTEERLNGFLENLKVLAEGTVTKKASPKVEEKETKQATILEDKPIRNTVSYNKEAAAKRIVGTSPTAKDSTHEDGFPNHFGRRVLIILLLLFMLSFLSLAAFKRFFSIYESSQYIESSNTVNLLNAKKISFGEKKNAISYFLKTNGEDIGDNRTVYSSTIKEDARKPEELIMIEYSPSNTVKAISYLNLKSVNEYFNLRVFNANISYDMSLEETSEAVGIPFSLYRKYFDKNNDYIEEVHFGYLDPTGNFNPAWRGEYEIIFNRTKETVVIKNWGPYDGSDPSMLGTIENTSYANQYDSYTDFLNDRYQFSRSHLLLNRYSLGDTKFFFDGEPVHYSNNFGYQFYSIDSPEKIEDTDTPLYRISIGYDNKGGFQMASFSNMRLYNKSGTLKDSNYRLLTRGMTYAEVQQLMGLIPTSIYIDSSYYSICYGRFLDTEVTDEQFEVIIRFGLEDNIAYSVLINAAVSGVTDKD